jgi:hypothetical protein
MGRSKARRKKDRKNEKAAKAIRVEAMKKEKENGKSSTSRRRIDAGDVGSTKSDGD